MSRRPARFTQADVRRACKALGLPPERAAVDMLPDGTIRVQAAPEPHLSPPQNQPAIRPWTRQ